MGTLHSFSKKLSNLVILSPGCPEAECPAENTEDRSGMEAGCQSVIHSLIFLANPEL